MTQISYKNMGFSTLIQIFFGLYSSSIILEPTVMR